MGTDASDVQAAPQTPLPGLGKLLAVLVAIAVAFGIYTATRGDDEQPSDLQRFNEYVAVESDPSCRPLFDFRNDLAPDSADLPAINARLRELGCTSAADTRTDRP